jgi:hypothetical protein
MKHPLAAAVGLAMFALTGAPGAQVRHRRPFAPSVNVNYGFDNNSGSGCRDYNCGSRCYDGHTGTDFGIPTGTLVLASADGVVVYTHNGCANTGYVGNPCGGRCGNYVQLEHADGSRTIYCHMQLDSLMVSRGQRVRCGQPLGRSASSGSSSGPHLHFGWKRSANAASIDSYRGRCTTSPGAWVDQRSYPMSPADVCACTPSPEMCNGRDDDCDGAVDEGLTRPCYTGPAGTAGRGLCREGMQTCSGGAWGACTGQTLPATEQCNRSDDDCDGTVDEGVCPMDAGTRPDATPSMDASLDAGSDRAEAPPHDAPRDVRSEPHDDVPEDTPDEIGHDAHGDTGYPNQEDVTGEVSAVDGDSAPEDADVAPDRVDVLQGGCGCRSGSALPRRGWAGLALACVALARRRRTSQRP